MNLNKNLTQFLPARNSPKEISGASGGFLPKPLLLRLRHPNSKKISRVFCEILSPKNSFRKTESALVPPPAQILGGQSTKEKCPFLFRRNWSRANQKSKEHFFWCPPRLCEAVAGLIHSFSFRSKKVRAKCIITAHRMEYRAKKINHERPPIAVDFDGVIHGYSQGFGDGSIYDGPIRGVVEAMTKLKEKYYVYIYSYRTGTKEGRDAVGEYLERHGVPYDEISTTKPPAKFYIDDRAIRFKNWKQTLKDLDSFEEELRSK